MANVNTLHDRLALFLSGGASNALPSASLGGAISSQLVNGMVAQYISPVEGLIVEDATPENGVGIGTIAIFEDTVTYTPPDGNIGASVTITAGQRKLVFGADTTKAVRVYRVSGLAFDGVCTFYLTNALNGVLAMDDLTDAERVAGRTTYRAMFLKNQAASDTDFVRLWFSNTGQATYSLAWETPSGGSIQTIADEETAPTGVVWQNATSAGVALWVGTMATGDTLGLWIRKTFPAAGTVAAKEPVSLHLQHQEI